MLLSVETIMNLQDQVLILALNLWNISHLLDYFSYLPLQEDSFNTRSIHVGCSAGSTEMLNHKHSFIMKRHLGLSCIGTWLFGAIIYNRYEAPYHLILSGVNNFVSSAGFEINQGKYCSSYLWYKDLLHSWLYLSWHKQDFQIPTILKISSDVFKTVFWVNKLLCVCNILWNVISTAYKQYGNIYVCLAYITWMGTEVKRCVLLC